MTINRNKKLQRKVVYEMVSILGINPNDLFDIDISITRASQIVSGQIGQHLTVRQSDSI